MTKPTKLFYNRRRKYTDKKTVSPYKTYGSKGKGEKQMNAIATLNEQQTLTIRAEFYPAFLSYIDTKPSTVETYTKALRNFARYLQENEIRQPRREDIIVYRDNLKETHAPATVQTYIIAIRLFFRFLEMQGLYPNVAEHIKGATISREHKKDNLTSEQAKTLLSSIDRTTVAGLRNYALISVMMTGGLRDIEIQRANIDDIRTVGNNTVLFIQGKGRDEKAEYIKLTAPVIKAIREYLKARGTAQATAPLFVSFSRNNNGGRLTTRAISGIVKDQLKAAGHDSSRLTAHSLRHTAATLNLLNGGTLEETQELLRHSNINTTMIYLHHIKRENNKSEERITAALFD